MTVNLLDPHLGVQNVLPPQAEGVRLPRPRALAQAEAAETGLAELYRLPTCRHLVLAGLKPRVPDEELLRPDLLNRHLESALAALRGSRHPDVRRFVHDDLGPLLEDHQLLAAYTGLMVGG